MFWDEHDLDELKGTSLVGWFLPVSVLGYSPDSGCRLIEKLGRADAEESYKEKLLPAIEVRPFIRAIK